MGVEVIGFDVTVMHPNLKIAYEIKGIDRSILLRISLKDDVTEKKKTEELKQIIIPMIIFLLEHQFVIVGVEGGREKGGEREIFREALLMGVIDMIDNPSRKERDIFNLI